MNALFCVCVDSYRHPPGNLGKVNLTGQRPQLGIECLPVWSGWKSDWGEIMNGKNENHEFVVCF